MMTNVKKHLLILLSLAAITACKSVRVLPNKAPVKRVDLKELTNEIAKTKENIPNFRVRMRATYNDQKQKQQVTINCRLERDKSLWMSASMLIPIAKILITPAEVQFYEKFQKTYYKGSLFFINQQLGTDFSFSDLQNIFLGNPISDFKKGDFERISHPQYYVLTLKSERQRFRPTYFFDPVTFRLKEQRFLIPGTVQSLSIKYTQQQQVEGKTVPKMIEISTFDGTQLVQLSLDFLRVDFPKKLTTPFRIPTGYKKIEL